MYLKLCVFVVCLGITTISAATIETSTPATECAIVVEVAELMKSGKIEQAFIDELREVIQRLKVHVDALVDHGAVEAGTDHFLRVCEIIAPAFDHIPEAHKDGFEAVEAILDSIADYIRLHL